MSQGKLIGAALAIVCGVATGYSTFAPELQKQQAERLGEPLNENPVSQEAVNHIKAGDHVTSPVVISNEATLGASVKEALHLQEKHPAQEGAWSGLSMFKWAFGGAEIEKDGDGTTTPSKPGTPDKSTES